MKNMEDVKEGRGGLIVYFSPRTLRGMYDDFGHIMRSDNFDYDFKRFIQNRMNELSERHVKLTGISIGKWTV